MEGGRREVIVKVNVNVNVNVNEGETIKTWDGADSRRWGIGGCRRVGGWTGKEVPDG